MIISMNAGNSIGKNPIPFHDNSKIGKEKKKTLTKCKQSFLHMEGSIRNEEKVSFF